jgi:hypothetical protein
MLAKTKLHQVYNGNFDITRVLDQSNLSVQRCQLIFWVECSVGGYLALAKTIGATDASNKVSSSISFIDTMANVLYCEILLMK